MARMANDRSQNSPRRDARALQVVRMAAVAAILFDPAAAAALLEIPDAELGRLFKIRLMQIAGLSTVLDLDANSICGPGGPAPNEVKRGAERAKSARYALIAKGKLLHLADFLAASGISEQRLAKDVAARRVVTVDIGNDAYYPAFYLASDVDRKTLAKVTRLLGSLPGWSKWQFFTTPKASLGKITPLKALSHGKVEQVAKAAAAFAERRSGP